MAKVRIEPTSLRLAGNTECSLRQLPALVIARFRIRRAPGSIPRFYFPTSLRRVVYRELRYSKRVVRSGNRGTTTSYNSRCSLRAGTNTGPRSRLYPGFVTCWKSIDANTPRVKRAV